MATRTGNSSIGTWFEDPIGGPLIRGLFEQTGQDEAALKPALGFALQRLVELSQGTPVTSATAATKH
jgi:hypothetical protein